MRRVLLLLASALMLSGCGNATAIDSRALALGLAVDPAKGSLLKYTMQMPTPQSLGGGGSQSGGGSSFYYPSATANSLAEAISHMEDVTSRDVYLGQIQFIFISTEVAPRQRDRFLSEMQRVGETDHTEWLALANGSAAQLLKPPQGQEELPAVYYAVHFSCTKCQSADMSVHLWRALADLSGPSHVTDLPVVSQQGGQPVIDRVAAVTWGRPAVVFSPGETMILMALRGKTTKGVLNVQTPAGHAALRSLMVKAHRSAQIVHGRLWLSEALDITGQVAKPPPALVRLTPGALAALSQATAQQSKNHVLALIRKTQSEQVDALGFGRELYMRDANGYYRLGNFARAYGGAGLSVRVTVHIPHQGVSV